MTKAEIIKILDEQNYWDDFQMNKSSKPKLCLGEILSSENIMIIAEAIVKAGER